MIELLVFIFFSFPILFYSAATHCIQLNTEDIFHHCHTLLFSMAKNQTDWYIIQRIIIMNDCWLAFYPFKKILLEHYDMCVNGSPLPLGFHLMIPLTLDHILQYDSIQPFNTQVKTTNHC